MSGAETPEAHPEGWASGKIRPASEIVTHGHLIGGGAGAYLPRGDGSSYARANDADRPMLGCSRAPPGEKPGLDDGRTAAGPRR
jgi:hypothetical protein